MGSLELDKSRGAGCAPGDIEAGDLGAGSRLLPVYSRYSSSGGGQGAVAAQWSRGGGWAAHNSRQLSMHQGTPPCILLRMCLYRFSCFVSLSYNIRTIKRLSVVVIFKF